MEVDFGVIYVLSLIPKKLAAPHSSMYFFFLGIQIELAGIAQIVRFLIGAQAGCVIAAHLVDTCAQRCGTVVFADNNVRIGGEPALEVRTYRRYKHDKQVFLCRMYAYLCSRTHQQRTDIQEAPDS